MARWTRVRRGIVGCVANGCGVGLMSLVIRWHFDDVAQPVWSFVALTVAALMLLIVGFCLLTRRGDSQP